MNVLILKNVIFFNINTFWQHWVKIVTFKCWYKHCLNWLLRGAALSLDPHSSHTIEVISRQHGSVSPVDRHNTGRDGEDLRCLVVKHKNDCITHVLIFAKHELGECERKNVWENWGPDLRSSLTPSFGKHCPAAGNQKKSSTRLKKSTECQLTELTFANCLADTTSKKTNQARIACIALKTQSLHKNNKI